MNNPESSVGIFGYGSLLSDPGKDIGPHIVERIPHVSPWKIEYARRSESRGGGPTLVIHKRGATVNGEILVLDVGESRLAAVREWLWERENRPRRRCIKEIEMGGLKHVCIAI
jgi:cation transport regulator ChaC